MVRFLAKRERSQNTMNYSEEEFYKLMEKVEEQGGEHLDEVCAAKKLTFSALPGEKPKAKPMTRPGCGNSALFEIPYETASGGAPTLGGVKVCAVDDGLGWWPRFRVRSPQGRGGDA